MSDIELPQAVTAGNVKQAGENAVHDLADPEAGVSAQQHDALSAAVELACRFKGRS